MRNCFVPGCDKDHKKRNLPQKRPMFVPPKDKGLFSRWSEALPKLRPLKQADRVCHMHFQPHEMQKSFQHIINGQVFQLERDRARLNANAVPSLHLPDINELEILFKARMQPRKTQKCEKRVPDEEHTVLTETYQEQEELTEQRLLDVSCCLPQAEEVIFTEEPPNPTNTEDGVVEANKDNNDNSNAVFANLFDEIFEVELPNTLWGIHRCPQRSIIFFTYMDAERMCATKMLTVDSGGIIKVFLASRLISTHSIDGNGQPTEALSVMLTQLDETHICPGADASDECEVKIDVASGRHEDHEQEQQQFCGNCLMNANMEVEIIESTD